MKIKVAKRFSCEVEVYNGDKLVDKYIAKENELVTKNPVGHRPQKDIESKPEIVETVKYKT
tara:strand:- start:312 stop:494 length:183 start_codon:yes stop_codon:yes gene_type:complete